MTDHFRVCTHFFPHGSPVWERSAISKHKYRFIMAMRKNLTRKTPTLFILLIKFLAVINVYFFIFSLRRKHWESFYPREKFPSKGKRFLLFMLKWLLLVLRKGETTRKERFLFLQVSQIQCFKRGWQKKFQRVTEGSKG